MDKTAHFPVPPTPAINGMEKQAFSPADALKRAVIDLKAKIPKPPVAIAFRNGMEEATVCTLGNISLVTGKAKSRKTFLISMLTAAALSNAEIAGAIRSYLPEEQPGVLYFDTEQSDYHAQSAVRRAAKLSGQEENPLFRAYRLREFSPAERYQLIHQALKEAKAIGIGFAIIDGVRDLIDDINNPAECNRLVTDLMKWSSEYRCHIVCVLHENKSSGTIRGHIGTELQNKAETVFKVEKVSNDEEVSIVHPEMTREKPFKPFAIYFNRDTHLPDIDHSYEISVGSRTYARKGAQEKKKTLADFTHSEHCTYLNRIFTELGSHLRYSQLKEAVADVYPNLLKHEAKSCSSFFLDRGLLDTNAENEPDKSKRFYTLTDEAKRQSSPF